jgi:hypothetical protein
MNKTLLLILAGVLLIIGFAKPNIDWINNKPVVIDHQVIEITKPINTDLLDECDLVINALKTGPSSRSYDGKRLASLYWDLSTLIELNGENLVIRNTEDIKQANSISGVLLQLDLKNKYPDLAQAAQKVISAAIGDDNVLLDETLRAKSVEGFRALAWACNEGSK